MMETLNANLLDFASVLGGYVIDIGTVKMVVMKKIVVCVYVTLLLSSNFALLAVYMLAYTVLFMTLITFNIGDSRSCLGKGVTE